MGSRRLLAPVAIGELPSNHRHLVIVVVEDDIDDMLVAGGVAYSGGKWTVTTATEGRDTLSGFSIVADGNGSGHHFILVVHQLMSHDAGAAWAEGEARESRLVFIGLNLPRELMTRSLQQCLA
jgi:hypothetical protein